MSVRTALRRSLVLLNKRERRILTLATVAQMATSLLDLVGVLLIGAVAGLSVAATTGSPAPRMIQVLLDKAGLGSRDTLSLTATLAVIAGFVLVFKSIISVVLTRRILRFLANRQAAVAGRLAETLLAQPLIQVQQRSSQETAYALTTGVNLATLVVIGQSSVAIAEIALLAVLALGLLAVDPLVTLFAIAYFTGVAFLLQFLLSGWASRLGHEGGTSEIDSYATIQEALRTYREITVSNRRSLYVHRFQAFRWRAASVQSDLQFMSLIPKYLFEVALVLGAGLLAASQLTSKNLSGAIATIVIFLTAGSRVVPSMLRFQGAALGVRVAAGGAAKTYELADDLAASGPTTRDDVHLDIAELGERIEAGNPDFEPTIRVHSVGVTYPGTRAPALINISVAVQAGQALALAGPTGAGKSTLADVILGVLTPDVGSIEIGGLPPIEAIAKWPGAIAYVPQDVAMANGTIRQNVALGLPDSLIVDERVWESLRRARLSDFLHGMRDGLDTTIGENGIRLSGGQRQRLGIARALYTRPRLLVLDEATSSLDAETERAIVDTLQDLEGYVTTVTVAHRLATIRHADIVMYLEGGRMVAAGTFNQVRELAPGFDEQAQLLGL